MTKHDPTEEAETLPGIPKAGSDLEQFPSVPGLFAGGGAFSIDVVVQEITAVLVGSTVTVAITAVADLTRSYLQIQGSPCGVPAGASDENGLFHATFWEFASTSSIRVSRNTGGGSITHKIAVIEFI